MKTVKKFKKFSGCPHCESNNFYTRKTGWCVCRKCGTEWKRPDDNKTEKNGDQNDSNKE